MKKKVIILISALFVFGLAIVAYSYTVSSNASDKTACCAMKDCCKDGTCKMGGECCKNHSSKEMSATHNHNGEACCKDGKCSMNSDCCKDGVCKMGCCKDGKCEMKKDGQAKGDCCQGKDSCPMHKGENKDKPNN